MADFYDSVQQQIINISNGSHLVLAAPGCGKTHILAHRILSALQRGISPAQMLCMTFTNRAARGMRSRIAQLVGTEAESLFVGNVHRYCAALLFEQGLLSLRTSIIDDNDIDDILHTICTRSVENFAGMHYVANYQHFMMQLRNNVDNELMLHIPSLPYKLELKQLCLHMRLPYSRQSVLHLYDHLSEVPEAIANHYAGLMLMLDFAHKYEDYKQLHNMVDFDDILILAYTYLRDNHHTRYPWMQIDEVQDLNPMQLAIIRLLFDADAPHSTLLYLGDEQQTIFSFIGAQRSTIETLKRECGDNLHRLSRNYRSPRHLLNLYNDYAEKQLGVDPQLLPSTDYVLPGATSDHLRLCLSETTDDEHANIATHLVPTLMSHPGETTAIIVPTNKDADKISALLAATPHFKISGQDIFMHPHMKALLAHLNLASNEHNLLSWAHLFRQLGVEPTYATSRTTVARLFNEGIVPSDFLRYEGETYVTAFCKAWNEQTIVVYDTETTGTDTAADDIVQLAAFKVRGGKKVEGSDFELLLHTDRSIPPMLGDLPNPLVEEYARRPHEDRRSGLARFVAYAESCVLCGHNVMFDNSILQHNLDRLAIDHSLPLTPTEGSERHFHHTFDSLALARRLFPHMRSYRLKALLEELHLSGENSHLATDDIFATLQLLNRCCTEALPRCERHIELLHSPEVQRVAHRLSQHYSIPYFHALHSLYNISAPSSLVAEMQFAAQAMQLNIPKFDLILEFVEHDVVNSDLTPTFAAQLSRHLLDLNSYRETDLCDSRCMLQRGERLFISTVHKAKGLEFDNVIISSVVSDVYPSFHSKTVDEQLEDARKLYVALSRAKRRIFVCHHRFNTFIDRNGISRTFSRSISPFCQHIVHHFKPLNFGEMELD